MIYNEKTIKIKEIYDMYTRYKKNSICLVYVNLCKSNCKLSAIQIRDNILLLQINAFVDFSYKYSYDAVFI